MIDRKECTIILDKNSTGFDVFDNNKLKAIEHKGHTSGGVFVYYFALYRNDKRGAFLGYYTPNEIIQEYGTYKIKYN